MKWVEIFKTNVADQIAAVEFIRKLKHILPEMKVNFDLEDCDNILRIESGKPIDVEEVECQLIQMGLDVCILE